MTTTNNQNNNIGYGKIIYRNGDIYEGDFINNCFEGKDKYTFTNSSIYEGDFINDKRHGIGKLVFKNGVFMKGCLKMVIWMEWVKLYIKMVQSIKGDLLMVNLWEMNFVLSVNLIYLLLK